MGARMRMRRTAAGVAVLAVVFSAAGCGSSPTTPVSRLTQIPPDQRTVLPVVAGPALTTEKTVSTADYRGKVVVLNIWGSWCSPCRQEAPALRAASEETKVKAQFIGITVKDPAPAAAEAFVRTQQISYPSIFDPSGQALLPLAGQYPPSAIPTTLILDDQGRLAVRALGELSQLTLEQLIDDVAAGK